MKCIWRYESLYGTDRTWGYVLSESDEASTVVTELYDYLGEGYKITEICSVSNGVVDLSCRPHKISTKA